jgi:hypothetical protein
MNIDLVSLIEMKAGISLVKKSNHFKFGSEFWGMCPFCKGGEDRFHCWPESERPHYWCRVCGKEGSPVQFLVDYCAMSYSDAYQELGIERDGYIPPPVRASSAHQPPCKAWQESAGLLIERAEKYLWHPKSPEGRRALIYLMERGLTEDTIKQARIGYVPLAQDGLWYKEPFSWWGIDPELLNEKDRAKGGVRIPPGILIPWFEGDTIWKLAVKRPGQEMDYGQIQGSGKGLYNVDALQPDKPAMLVESELCALSVQQEAGDLVACVATGGSKQAHHLHRWLTDLCLASHVLQSFDADDAGDKESAYWLKILPHALHWRPWADEWGEDLRFKDPNDMLGPEFQEFTGTNLRGWVEAGLWAAQLEPLYEDDPFPKTGGTLPAAQQHAIDVQAEFERLCVSEQVGTPDGLGRIWDAKQLRLHIERDAVRVTLDRLKDSKDGATRLFPAKALDPVLQTVHLAF